MSALIKEPHRTTRLAWLRASVLGANDGILSTASLLIGVAAAHGSPTTLMVAGASGLVAGAMGMAAGEYVSVHSQADAEEAELARETLHLHHDFDGERSELMAIYIARGLDPALAEQVATQLMAHDALGAHARDELGIVDTLRAHPVQAAVASASSFAAGALLPLLVARLAPQPTLIPAVAATSLVFLAMLGALAARAGGARMTIGASRVTFWGALAMALTAAVGGVFGAVA
jgi:vacuolar iron transporter family protein